MAVIRPGALPAAGAVANDAAIMIDTGASVEKATPAQLVDAAIPLASQAEAEAGTNNTKRVTPLRVKQAIDALGVSSAQIDALDATVNGAVGALNNRLREETFAINSIRAFGDSFSLQPNPHTAGDSMVKKYATLQGVASPVISATSGNTSADGQAAIFAASIAPTDHTIHAFGQNDAQFLGTGTDKSARLSDLGRIHLANLAWLAKAAGTNKVAAGSASAGQLAVAGTWTADPSVPGGFRSSTPGDAMQATFTNCRFGLFLYGAKIGSTGRIYAKLESDDTNRLVFSAAPESGWVPTNTGQTWAIMARAFDFGAKLPTAALQVGVDVTTGGGDVVPVGFLGFSGDLEAGPLLGVADVSRRGPAGYATAAGSDVNVPIVNRIIAQAVAAAAGFGARVIDLPVASVVDGSTGLAADEFHPNEVGASAIASAWEARVDNGAPLAGNRLDLAVQGVIQNMGGDDVVGAPLVRDREGRTRFRRLGGAGIEFVSTDNIVRMSTSGVYLTPVASNGVADPNTGLLLLSTGSDCFVQGRIGDLVFGAASNNRFRISGDALVPESASVQSFGSFAKPAAAMWSDLVVAKPRVVSALPSPAASIVGCRATVTDATARTYDSVVAGGGAETVKVWCDGSNWRIG